MRETLGFVCAGRESGYTYGADHPLQLERYTLACALIDELGLTQAERILPLAAGMIDEAGLLRVHDTAYLDRLREFSASDRPRADFAYGLGDVENPVFPGCYEWSRLVCGATRAAVRAVAEKRVRRAFHLGGGWHHAHRARASGFSYLNDAAVAIAELVEAGCRVAYVDIDAHHGDGVQNLFYDSDRVLTVSIHETGDDFFPHTGYVHEQGEGQGNGFALNVPLLRHSDDAIFCAALEELILPAVRRFSPDILITQTGVDSLRTDPLARLEMTTAAIETAARAFAALDLPWVALGGGGYRPENVARAWALVFAIMAGRDAEDPEAPGPVLRSVGGVLRDAAHVARPADAGPARAAYADVCRTLRRTHPLLRS